VRDATSGYQLVGKQHLNPHGIWYTRVTGIWQTVWMEEVNARAIEDLTFTCDINAGTIHIRPKLAGPAATGEKLRVSASHQGLAAGTAEGAGDVVLKIANPKLWSPDAPNL
jgi:beta-galactosidase